MEKLYGQAAKSFVDSDAFKARVKHVHEQVLQNPKKMWVLTRDLFQDIKAYKKKADKFGPSNGDHGGHSSEANGSGTNGEPSAKRYKASDSQIERLESLLESHYKEIEKLESAELSLDDLESEDSSHLIAERLKQRAAKIFKKLCLLKDRSQSMGGLREKRFKYTGSRYEELNMQVQKFVNKHSLEERMPDYNDIRKIVKLSNTKYGYSLTRQRIVELSKEVSEATPVLFFSTILLWKVCII